MISTLTHTDIKYVQRQVKKAHKLLAEQKLSGTKAIVGRLKKRIGLTPGIAHLSSLVAIHEKKYDVAWRDIEQSLSAQPTFAPNLLLKARLLYRRGQHSKTLSELSSIDGPVKKSKDYWRYKLDALIALGELDAAVLHNDEFFHEMCNEPEYNWAKGELLLRLGDSNGWELIDNRYRVEGFSDLDSITCWQTGKKIPHWSSGKAWPESLLIIAEQGLGDTVHFSRYIVPLINNGVQVCIAEFEKMHSLLSQLDDRLKFIDRNKEVSLKDGQAWVRMMSLPSRLRDADLLSQVNSNAYLKLSEVHTPECERPINQLDERIKVGLVWKGNPDHANDHFRSFQIDDFEPLFQSDCFQVYNLQFGASPEEKTCFITGQQPLEQLAHPEHAFLDFAHAARELDVIVSVDSAPIHVAGALGIPAFVLLNRCVIDWRWETPFGKMLYDTVQLHRQRRNETKRESIMRLCKILQSQVE